MSWSGSVRQTARELSATLAVPRTGSVTPPALREGAYLTLRRAGETVFTGPLLTATTSSQDSLVDLSALDRGRFLVGNEGWYSFSGITPETGRRRHRPGLRHPGGRPGRRRREREPEIPRRGPGQNHPHPLRPGRGAKWKALPGPLHRRRGPGGGGEAHQRVVVHRLHHAVTNTWDITNLQNSVAIRTQEGALVRRVEDADSVALNGRLEHVITQRDGGTRGSEAQAWLEDNGLQQNLTVETLGDPRLITGEAVLLRDTGSGVSGLFWIDGDTHTWKNGQYYCKLTLNFRNLVDDTRAGSEL